MTSIKLGAVDTRSSVLVEIGCGLIQSTPTYLSIIYYSIVYNNGIFPPHFKFCLRIQVQLWKGSPLCCKNIGTEKKKTEITELISEE